MSSAKAIDREQSPSVPIHPIHVVNHPELIPRHWRVLAMNQHQVPTIVHKVCTFARGNPKIKLGSYVKPWWICLQHQDGAIADTVEAARKHYGRRLVPQG